MSFKGLILGAILGLLAGPIIAITFLFLYTSAVGPFSGDGFKGFVIIGNIGVVITLASVVIFSFLGATRYRK